MAGKNKNANEDKILFPEVSVKVRDLKEKKLKEIKLTPWSFGELAVITPIFESIFSKLRAKGFTFEGFEALGADEEKITEDTNLEEYTTFIEKTLIYCPDEVKELLKVSAGLSEEDLDTISGFDAVNLFRTILMINPEVVYNFFDLFRE